MLVIQTPVNQVMKLSTLVEHYFEHQSLNPEISFADFLTIHYAQNNVKHGDYERDMQLPFKQYNHTSLVFTFIAISNYYINHGDYILPQIKTTCLFKSPYYPSEYPSAIWQPPRA